MKTAEDVQRIPADMVATLAALAELRTQRDQLLAACEEALQEAVGRREDNGDRDERPGRESQRIARLRDAIVKAKGGDR